MASSIPSNITKVDSQHQTAQLITNTIAPTVTPCRENIVYEYYCENRNNAILNQAKDACINEALLDNETFRR